MNPNQSPPIFDGHNDVLSLQARKGPEGRYGFANGYDAHIDLPKAKAGGLAGGFFAIYVPSTGDFSALYEQMTKTTYDLPLPPPVPHAEALPVVMKQAAILQRLEDDGSLKICRTTADISACLDTGQMSAIMHIEGAEGIDTDFHSLEVLYMAGLRSLGPVWSRPTAFGEGVPFRHPSDGDVGDGLTDAGKNLVKECNRLGVMIDLSHLNTAGFWDVAKLSDAPLVATHSNVHAICPNARNLTDDQLAAIKASDGMVGLNYAVAFLRPDGAMRADTSVDLMIQHLDYLIEHLGEDRVGLGSDFDGAMVPEDIKDAAGLTVLRDAMRAHGYSEALMTKICYENWLRVLAITWRE